MRAVENDLIDEYVRGQLSSNERAKFEEMFLANPTRAQRIDFARTLADISSKQLDTASATTNQSTAAIGNLFGSFVSLRSRVRVYGLAVLIIAVLVGSLWLFVRRSSRREPVTAQQTPGSTQASSGAGPSPEAKPSQTAESSRQESTAKEERPRDRAPAPEISSANANVATFILLPGLTRSEGERTKLTVPPGRQSISLKLFLTEPDAKRYRNFTAELSGASGTVWTANSLAMRKDGSVILNFPVSRLKSNTANYDLTLRGRAARSLPFETLGYYYLTITSTR